MKNINHFAYPDSKKLSLYSLECSGTLRYENNGTSDSVQLLQYTLLKYLRKKNVSGTKRRQHS